MSEFDETNVFLKGRVSLLEEENKQLKERLYKVQENEKKFRMFFEKSRDPFLLIKDFKFVDANPAALKMLKIQSLDELQNTHPATISPEFQDDGKPSILKANEMMNISIQKGFHSFEWKHIDSDGNPFYVIVSLTPIVINNELIIFTHWLDYNEFKKKEVERDTFQKIIDAVIERHIRLICITDINGIYLNITKTYSDILGFEPEDLINKVSVFSLIHPDDFMSVFNIYTKSFIANTSNFVFHRFRKKDGTYCIVESFGSPIYNEKKEIEKVVYLSYVLKDENPTKKDIESKFITNNFLNLVPYPFLIIQSKKIIFLNEVAEKLFGYNSFEIAGKDYSSIFIDDNSLKEIIEKPTQSLEGKIYFENNIFSMKKKNGEIFSALINIVPSNPEFDNEAYIVFINELPTGKKEIKESNQYQESEHDNLKDIILDNLGYELRTPLNGIIGAAQYLKTYILTKDDRKFAELITESSTKLLKTLTSIIDLSELEIGTKSVFSTSIDLIELINSSILNFTKDADFKDIYLTFETDLTDAIVHHDPLIISNILNPLIDNAIKFTKYGEVVISLAKSSRINDNYKYIIKVRDTGIGIEEEEYNSIFDAFKKSHISSNRKIPGLGLGLAIVKKYSELGNIDIDFTSQLGFGTTFSIFISDYKED
jgi:PAS domain S-box-containing protein